MWLLFGAGAIVLALFNVIWFLRKKNAKWFRFLSLSLTALTLCDFYRDGAVRVVREDWGGLMDIMPTLSQWLWFCTVVSILINSVSLFRGND